jgi:hypothetical protein
VNVIIVKRAADRGDVLVPVGDEALLREVLIDEGLDQFFVLLIKVTTAATWVRCC